MNRKRVGILIFPDVEVLDFAGPFEVFSVARLDESKRREEPSPFEVFLVAEQAEPVRTAGGMRVTPDYTLESCPRLDLLVVPGGWGTRRELDNQRLLDWIAALDAPTLLVVGSYLGTLSHSLTAAAALRSRGVTIAGVVVSESEEQPVPAAETAATLARFTAPVPVRVLPRAAPVPLLPLVGPYLK